MEKRRISSRNPGLGRGGRRRTSPLHRLTALGEKVPWRRLLIVLFVGLIVVGVGSGVRTMRARKQAATQVVVTRPLVVLPFTTTGSDSTEDYLSEGVSSELVRALSQARELRVAPSITAAVLRRQGKTAREIGAALRVRTVIAGSMQHTASRLRLRVDILNVADGATLWSDNLEGDVSNVLALQQELDQRVTAALREKLAIKADAKAPARGPVLGTADAVAFDRYLHGKFLMATRSEPNVRRASTLFQEALARDTGFARAYGGLAVSQVMLTQLTPKPDPALAAAAIASAQQALDLAPADPDGLLATGFITMLRVSTQAEAEKYLKRAVDLEPGRLLGHEWYADLLGRLGRYDESLDQIRVAQRLDPTSPRIAAEVADVLFNVRYQAALALGIQSSALDTVLALAQKNYTGALAFLHQSDEMVRAFSDVIVLDPLFPNARGHLVYALAAVGKRAQADKMAADLMRDGEANRASAYEVALSRMGLGESDAALKWLRKSIEANELDVAPKRLACDPYFDPLGPDVRFMEILRKIGARSCPRAQ